MTPCR